MSERKASRLLCRFPLPALLGAALCLAAPAAAWAADTAATDSAEAAAPERELPPAQAALAESARRGARATSEWLARGVDSWFGDKPFSEGGQVSDGVLSLNLLSRQHEKSDFSLRFNARWRLPNVEERAYLFIGRDDEREVVSDKPALFTRQQQLLRENSADRSFFAGIGLQLRDSVDLRVGLRSGVKPYAQARYRKPWQLGPADVLEFRETLFWRSDEHVGSTTALSWEHAYSPLLALRWLSAATITERTRDFEWSSSLGLYRSFGDLRVLGVELALSGKENSGVDVGDYGVQLKWQQPLHKDWLIGELLVGHFWPRADAASERGRAWAMGLGLKLKF